MTPTFKVIDKQTGREYSEKNVNTDGLMNMDLDQMFLGEDGSLVMADDCNNIAFQDRDRFKVVIDGYVELDKALEIIDKVIEGQMKQAETFNGNGCHSLAKTHHDQACGAQMAKQAVLRLKEGKE